MTTDVKLLPSSVAAFTEALKGGRGALDGWLECNNEAEVRAHVEAYARANMNPLIDENERLRAEVEKLRGVVVFANDGVADTITALDARAERLAEAGRRVTAAFRAHGEASSFTRQAERTRHECEVAMMSLDAALRDHDQEEGK